MGTSLFIAIVGGLSVLNSIFLGVLLLTNHRRLLKNILLGFVFLSLAVRIGKSLLIVIFHDVPDSIPAIGLLGMVATGPLAYFYIDRLAFPQRAFTWRASIHFAPVLLVTILLPLSSDAVVFWLYVATSLQFAIYLALTYPKIKNISEKETKKWSRLVWVSLVLFWVIYSSQIIIETDGAYLTVTFAATVVLYILLFFAFRLQKPFAALRMTKPPDERVDKLAGQLTEVMEKEMLYKEPELTINKVAERLHVKPYLISRALSLSHKKSFPEFVNHYRMQEAALMLTSEKFLHFTIEAIAFDCGFSTPSAFYVAFKKSYNVTPGEFRSKTSA
ncbi:MAG: helix-turn-helix transcriptional regulator [Chitinophagaceae bacterium]|nr:helix-turn-helix transcriptional regulator [Chitinophagaceae bacterium]MCW5925840.1 helix-turn-helix transcriptional regulator [Chitinophagaceae bacterium]